MTNNKCKSTFKLKKKTGKHSVNTSSVFVDNDSTKNNTYPWIDVKDDYNKLHNVEIWNKSIVITRIKDDVNYYETAA